MSYKSCARGAKAASLAVALLSGGSALSMLAVPARAQDAPVSSNANINLLNLLVKKGVISRKDADALIKEANDEAASTRAPASPRAAAAAPPPAAAATVSTTPPGDGAMHVVYVPDAVRTQIKNELRHEVMAQARQEHWAAPDSTPEWTQRIRFFGDVRTRYEGDLFPKGNDNSGAFPNFNAINTGNPFDTSNVSNPNFPPEYDVDQNRNRVRLQLRVGLDANLGDDFLVGVRIGSGSDNQPVSLNQSLGGNGGDFSKYQLWLDRAYLEYKPHLTESLALDANVGRFPNPFQSTDLIFDKDLNFDGGSLKTTYDLNDTISAFAVGGAFPIFNTAFDFATYQPAKFASDDKYLFGGQAGIDWKVRHDWDLKLAGAYYDFDNVAGRLSSACTVVTIQDSCDTDQTRPSFAQKGNTYMALRQIVPTAQNDFGTIDQFQYYGLASGFRVVTADARLDFGHFDPFHIAMQGEFVDNIAFDKSAAGANAVNNRGSIPSGGTVGPYGGGNIGYFINGIFGAPELAHRWDWNFSVGYKYLESDAVLDGMTDADFGLGGTNLKGYVLRANLALSSRVYAGVNWFSADSIAGAPYSSDVVQFDIGARF